MKARTLGSSVIAPCPSCKSTASTFEANFNGNKIGSFEVRYPITLSWRNMGERVYQFRLLRCASCDRGALATYLQDELVEFLPETIERKSLPATAPQDVIKEFREAEDVASIQCWRAAAALLRSALEKTLKVNGYSGNLYTCIKDAESDGVLTSSRAKKAQELIRVLGNDVLHGEWREVSEVEVKDSFHYVNRVIEDFYDDRETVETLLVDKKRISETDILSNNNN